MASISKLALLHRLLCSSGVTSNVFRGMLQWSLALYRKDLLVNLMPGVELHA